MASTFPRQDVSESEKNKNDKQWYKDAVDAAAKDYCTNGPDRISKITRLQNQYNGVVNAAEFTQFDKTYGADNAVKYIDYRLCRAKIDNLVGESLMIPLKGTIYTTNPEAKVRKLDDVAMQIGYHFTKDKVDTLRNVVGVDVFNGMPAPEVPQGKSIFDLLSKKSQNEVVMQKIMNRQKDQLKLPVQFSESFLDATLTSECFGKVYINSDGQTAMRSIPIEDALFVEAKKDPFLDRSPYLGERRVMFYHELLKEFNLDKATANKLWEIADGKTDTSYDQFSNVNYPTVNGVKAFSVYTIEWIGLEAERMKTYIDKKTGEEREAFYSASYYEEHEDRIKNDVKKGRYKVETRWRYVLYEATRIGTDVYVQMEPVKYMPRQISRPSWTMRRYVGMLFGTVGGRRVSIKQMTEHIDRTYNMVMWQINRELYKAKGKVLAFDLAMLQKGKTTKDVMYNITNDSLLTYNSSEEGNTSQQNIENKTGISALDLGVSNTINVLIPLKVDLEQTADRITGILQSRMGNIAASATVSNTRDSIQSSRTTTYPLFYFFGNYVERCMRLVLEFSKIEYGILNPEKGEMILGIEGLQFLNSTEDIIFDDYGFELGDIGKETRVRQMLQMYGGGVLNSTPEALPDLLDAELADTVAESTGIMRETFRKLMEVRQSEAAAQSQAAMDKELAKAQGQENVQGMKNQGNLEQIAARGVVDSVKQGQAAKNQAILQRGQGQEKSK